LQGIYKTLIKRYMNLPRPNLFLWLACIGILFSACDKKWEEHNAVTDPLAGETLLNEVNKNPDLSKFSEYLTITGYDKILASSSTFTVWAPTNAALQAVDPEVIDTDEELKLFVGMHIAPQSFLTTAIQLPYVSVKTLSKKNVTLTTNTVDEITLISKDKYLGNGVLNTIGTALVPKVNAWEYLMSTNSLQKEVLAKYTFTFRDLNRAEQIGVDPATGEPVYKEGTGFFTSNSYLDRYFFDANGTGRRRNDIRNEDSLFTYIILTDDAFLAEKNKLQKYYAAGDSTDSITSYNVVKDMVFSGLLNKNNFPETVYSAGDSVKFHLKSNAVVETHRVSNGVVYVMSSVDYDLGVNGVYDPYAKIKPIVIQGENLVGDMNNLNAAARAERTRIRRNPNTQQMYTDFLSANHGKKNYWIRYQAPGTVHPIKYKVYWVAVNDFQEAKFPMSITFNKITQPRAFTKEVELNDYSEVELGEYTFNKLYSNTTASLPLPVFLMGPDIATNGLNTLVLDYIKLVPFE
jgi:uncharacterized surface protein with fasciclin (FAS1) repeats